jgi:hypothetical protein
MLIFPAFDNPSLLVVSLGGCELPGPLNAGNGSQGWLVDSRRERLERVTGAHENRKPLG